MVNRLLFIAAGLTMGFFLGACGDDDSADDATETTAVAPDTAVPTSVVDITVPATTPPPSPGLPTTVAPSTTPTATSTTTPPVAMTIGQVEAYMAEQWPGSASADRWGVDVGRAWSCERETAGELATGAVLTCRPDPPVLEGQHPVTTVLVLDTGGTLAVMESGVVNPVLLADVIVGEVGSGLNCSRLLDSGSALMSGIGSGLTDEDRYGAVILYWFLEGRPSPLMDLDENGIPCETKFGEAIVTKAWSGGWLPRP